MTTSFFIAAGLNRSHDGARHSGNKYKADPDQ